MEKEVSEIMEVTLPIPERTDGEGVCPGGIYGGIEPKAMIDRAKRVKGYRERLDYRECIPCDRCGNCLEMRRFTARGEEQVMALYCLTGELETTPFNTCNCARRSRNGRKKVVYYLENAPADFRASAEMIRPEVPYMSPGMGKKLEPTMPSDGQGYVGGSGYYKRGNGEGGQEGSPKIPNRLMN